MIQEQAVIIGAGPYGLSLAAHLRAQGMRLRIFGTPMGTWRTAMPAGMLLKSDGFASNLSDPEGALTLARYCREQGIAYDDRRVPVAIATFAGYGMEFQRRMVPMLEERQVTALDAMEGGYRLRLDSGEVVTSQAVIVAAGITHFAWIPPALAGLPEDRLAHSAAIREPAAWRGRRVTVVGSGASAIDLAALLHESGAETTLLARREALVFHQPPVERRSLWNRLRWPQTGLGPGWRSKFCTDAPLLFHRLPEKLRLKVVERHLGPSAGWPMRERVMGRFPLLLGQTIESAEVVDGGVRLGLVAGDGSRTEHRTEMVIAATGYRVDLRRLPFLAEELRVRIAEVEQTPVLDRGFQSSVPGLYFTGLAAANSFGPMLRFAYGAEFAARCAAKAVARYLTKHPETAAKPEPMEAAGR